MTTAAPRSLPRLRPTAHHGVPLLSQALLVATLATSLSPSPAFAASLGTVTLAVLCLQKAPQLGRLRVEIPLLVLVLLVVGLVGLAWSTPTRADLTRDIFAVLRVCVLLLVGAVACIQPGGAPSFIRAFVLAGGIEAALHLSRILTNPSSFNLSLYLYREETGQGSLTEVLALAFLLLWRRAGFAKAPIPRALRWALVALISISTLLYFSRTMLIGIVVVALVAGITLSTKANRSASSRVARATLTFAIVAVIGLLTLLVLPMLGSGPVADLVTKFENSLVEITPRAAQSQIEITQNYRAYESFRALESFGSGTATQQWIGRGWGYSVNLVVDTASSRSETSRTTAPVLHNGYLFVLVKAGIVGVALYLLLLLAIARRSWRATQLLTPTRLVGAISLGACVLTVATTFVIGGLITSAGFNSTLILLGAAISIGCVQHSVGSSRKQSPRVDN